MDTMPSPHTMCATASPIMTLVVKYVMVLHPFPPQQVVAWGSADRDMVTAEYTGEIRGVVGEKACCKGARKQSLGIGMIF